MDYVSNTERVVRRREEIIRTLATFDELRAELREIDAYLEAGQRLATRCPDERQSLTTGANPPPQPAAGSGDEIFAGIDIDLSRCFNTEARLLAIGRAVGEFHAMQVAKYLIQRGISNAKPGNLRSRILNVLNGHPNFVRVGPSLFRYIDEYSDDDSSLRLIYSQEASNFDKDMV